MKTIVTATDFSKAADNACNYAISLATQFGARLVFVNAYSMPLTGFDTVPSVDILGRISEIAEESMKALVNRTEQGNKDIQVKGIVRMGQAETVIKEIAAEYFAGLVVMGIEKEAGMFKEHFIGSTAISLARNCEVPVLIVPEGARYKKIEKISFAWSLEGDHDTNLAYKARYFCNTFSASLEVVNVERTEVEAHSHRSKKLEFLENNFKNIKHQSLVIENDNAIEALTEHYKWYPADLIMLSPKKYGVLGSLFHKSATSNLAFHSKIPLLAIH